MLKVTVAKTVLLTPDGTMLVLKRSQTDAHRAGQLDLPGGWIEPGEDILHGAAREIREESGLEVSRSSLEVVYTATEAYDDRSVSRLLLVAHVPKSEVTLSHEHDECRWLPLDEALQQLPDNFYLTGLRYAAEHDLL